VRTYYPGRRRRGVVAVHHHRCRGSAGKRRHHAQSGRGTARVSGIVRDAQGRPGLTGSLSLFPSQSASSLGDVRGSARRRQRRVRVPERAARALCHPGVPRNQESRDRRRVRRVVPLGGRARYRGDHDSATAGSAIVGRLTFRGATRTPRRPRPASTSRPFPLIPIWRRSAAGRSPTSARIGASCSQGSAGRAGSK
jgi:hypothetical protein